MSLDDQRVFSLDILFNQRRAESLTNQYTEPHISSPGLDQCWGLTLSLCCTEGCGQAAHPTGRPRNSRTVRVISWRHCSQFLRSTFKSHLPYLVKCPRKCKMFHTSEGHSNYKFTFTQSKNKNILGVCLTIELHVNAIVFWNKCAQIVRPLPHRPLCPSGEQNNTGKPQRRLDNFLQRGRGPRACDDHMCQ